MPVGCGSGCCGPTARGARDDQVVASVDQAAATLAAWLRPATTRQRRAEGRGADAAGDDAPDDE
jgi:hypothetical protein